MNDRVQNNNRRIGARWFNRIVDSAFLLGMGIALVGLAFDQIVPGASPGLNLPQLFIIAGGTALALLALLLRRRSMPGLLKGNATKGAVIVASLSVTTLLVLELLLATAGITTYFPATLPERDLSLVYTRTCEGAHCTFYFDSSHSSCAGDDVVERRCQLNSMGYYDADEFVPEEDFPDRFRLLFMGDSVTAGYSAELGLSYVEAVEAARPDAVVWNVAFDGTGTNQDVAAFDRFGPLLRPQLSILGFVMNDFHDNTYVPRNLVRLEAGDGTTFMVEPVTSDRWGNPVDIPDDLEFAYLTEGYAPPMSDLERAIGMTRIGSLALRALDLLAAKPGIDESFDNQLRITRRYLAQLRDAVYDLEGELVVLLVPRRNDLASPGTEYVTAVQVMQELGIPYFNPIELLDPVADYALPPDGHWNSAGHQKIGAHLLECINVFAASGKLEDCDNVFQVSG